MKGQWIGRYMGYSEGTIIVNVDERTSYYQGVAYLNEDNKALPNTAAFFKSKTKDRDFQFRTDLILPINPFSGNVDSWENIRKHYPENVAVSEYADVTGTWDDTALSLSWSTALGVTGSCILPRTKADRPSELVPRNMRWEGYKKYVANLKGRRYLFRGQTKPWRLRTSFHRTGRADLGRFLSEDIQALHRHLSARTRHVFNLDIPNENGAFFNLVQHHGYPTPLLDWTCRLNEKNIFHYLFDFGDDWWHRIKVQKIIEMNSKKKHIQLIKSVGESPPQYPDYDDYGDEYE